VLFPNWCEVSSVMLLASSVTVMWSVTNHDPEKSRLE
jgi:hypothetical protein